MRRTLSVDEYYKGIREGERAILAKSLTLIESLLPRHQEMAQELLKRCLPHTGHSMRIGLSGVPGAGKSTFIEALGQTLIEEGHRVAVLAIDPSGLQGGSLLGDKTRMRYLSSCEEAFIRPSPNGGKMGGVAQTTLESLLICEAAGYDVVLIETVGVGQSETVVSELVDLFVMLAIPGAGDELQGMKRGILEVIDLLVINKADGEREMMAQQAKQQYLLALSILHASAADPHAIPVLTCSSVYKKGIVEVWHEVERLFHLRKESDELIHRRQEQQVKWMWRSIEQQLMRRFTHSSHLQVELPIIESLVRDQKLTPFEAASQLLSLFISK